MGKETFNFDKSAQTELVFEGFPPNISKEVKEITTKQAAKYMATAYNKWCAILTEKNILGKSSDGRYMPFKQYIDQRWFIVRQELLVRKSFRGNIYKVTITALGFNEIKKIVNGK